ncbi:MAG: Ig-like domain repeat protein, partial [Gemmataceae bacterium]
NVRALFVTADSSKFNNSTSNSVLQQIGYIPTISLNQFSNPVERGTPVTFTAVVGYQTANGVPTGTVTFQTADGSQTIATVNPPTQHPVGTMTYTVTVDPSMLPLGDNSIVAVYNRNGGSYVTQTSKDETLTLVGRATTTTLTANPVSGVYGSPVEFIATVTPNGPPAYAGGSVEFYAAGTLVQSIPLSWDSSGNPLPVTYTSYGLEAGNLSVVAVYTGDLTNYQGSTSNEVVVDVSKAATQLTLNPSVARVEVGTPVTLTATLTNSAEDPAVQPAGTIDFYRDGLKIGTAALKGNTATIVVTPDQVGTFQYEAKYAGNNNYSASSGSTSVSAFQQVQENFYLVAPQSGPFVQMFNRLTNEQMTVFQPFGPNYTGGFTVTKGDVNNDGVADLLYSARWGGQVQIYDGSNFNPLGAVYPFGPGLPSALSIAVGDINGDGFGDVIAAPASVGMPPHVVAISGRDMTSTLFSQYAYSTAFLGGVSVAAGEVNGDGAMDIITAPLAGAPPHIVTFDGKTGAVLQSYYAYSPLYRGGTSIAAADLDGDGFTEIITGASAAAPHVVVVDSRTMSVKASFYAYAPNFGGGVRVATVQDINADGVDDILVSPGPGAGPNVVRFDGKKALQNQAVVIDSFFAYGPGPSLNIIGGTFVG